MKLYIVTETNKETNLLLRSWVCFTEKQAEECLKKYYDIACAFNQIAGKENPTDCTEYGFFFWDMGNGMELKYTINETKTFAE